MGANKLEAFDVVVINRSKINEADYNPRQITESAKKKLNKFLKTNGLWCPLIVNKRTMTLVSGHQRINAMDTILRTSEYDITVSMVDVDEKTEVAGNIFMNNQSAMGDWDYFKLESIHESFPEIDFENDLAFDQSDIRLILGDIQKKEDEEEKQAEIKKNTADTFRDMMRQESANKKNREESGDSYDINDSDYSITFVFPNNNEKRKFLEKLKKDPSEKYIKSAVLFDIYNKKYNLSSFEE